MPFKKYTAYQEKPIKIFQHLMRLYDLSYEQAQRVVSKKRAFENGVTISASSKVVQGVIDVILFESMTKGLKPIFVTPSFAIFDKPSGVLIHPQNMYSPYSLLEETKYHFGKEANIVHRIDQETSGIVLVARTKEDEIALKKKFEKREIHKSYLALVYGSINKELFIDAPLLRDYDKNRDLQIQVRVDNAGKASQTIIRPIHYFKSLDATLVEAFPLTGRQHQIRVHLFHVKHSIIGDPLYGIDERFTKAYLEKELSHKERKELFGADRLFLHANSLFFDYPNPYIIYSRHNFLEYIKEYFRLDTL